MDGEKEKCQQADRHPFISHNDSNDYLESSQLMPYFSTVLSAQSDLG